MAKTDTVFSMFGMKTPQEIAREEMERSFKYLSGQRTGYQQAGAGIGLFLGNLIGGETEEMRQSREREDIYTQSEKELAEAERKQFEMDANAFTQDLTPETMGAAVAAEKRLVDKDDPFNMEIQELNRRADQLKLMADKFKAAGQPSTYTQGLEQEALKTRMLAYGRLREKQKFAQDTAKSELDIQFTQERINELQNKDKLTPAQLAEIQLKSTAESYQKWLTGKGTLVPNPKASNNKIPAAIQEFEYFNSLPNDQARAQFLNVKRSGVIRDLGDRFGFFSPTEPGKEVASVPKEIPPEQQPQAVTERKIAEGVGEEVAESRVKAPGQLMQMSEYDAQLQDLLDNPGSPAIFGFGGETRAGIAGTDAFGAASKLEQVQGSAFLSAVPQMKGLGALSDAEGRAITASVNALKIGLPWKQAKKEIAKVRTLLARGQERIKENQLLTPDQVLNNALGLTEERMTSGGIRYKIIGQ